MRKRCITCSKDVKLLLPYENTETEAEDAYSLDIPGDLIRLERERDTLDNWTNLN